MYGPWSLLNHAPNHSHTHAHCKMGSRSSPRPGPQSRLCAGSGWSAAWTTEPAGVDPRDPARQWDLNAISPMAYLQLQLPLYPNCPRCWGSLNKSLANSSERLPSFQENPHQILNSHWAEAGPVLSFLLKRKCLPPGEKKQKKPSLLAKACWFYPAHGVTEFRAFSCSLLEEPCPRSPQWCCVFSGGKDSSPSPFFLSSGHLFPHSQHPAWDLARRLGAEGAASGETRRCPRTLSSPLPN